MTECYVYESHMGGLYTNPYLLDYDELYCEQCGDMDIYIGEVYDEDSMADIIVYLYLDGYSCDYIQEFIDENFPEYDIQLPEAVCDISKTEHPYFYLDMDKQVAYCEFFKADCVQVGTLKFEQMIGENMIAPYCDECGYLFDNELRKLNPQLNQLH